MKTKRDIKVGDMVWYNGERYKILGVDDKGQFDVESENGMRSYDHVEPHFCKLIIPRKKKAKKDRKVRIAGTVPSITYAKFKEMHSMLKNKKLSKTLEHAIELSRKYTSNWQ